MKRWRAMITPRLIAGVALSLPMPGAAAPMMVTTCAGGSVALPVEGPEPASDHGCCRKACHAGTDRRKRGALEGGCC
jgi:hypothetical protein